MNVLSYTRWLIVMNSGGKTPQQLEDEGLVCTHL